MPPRLSPMPNADLRDALRDDGERQCHAAFIRLPGIMIPGSPGLPASCWLCSRPHTNPGRVNPGFIRKLDIPGLPIGSEQPLDVLARPPPVFRPRRLRAGESLAQDAAGSGGVWRGRGGKSRPPGRQDTRCAPARVCAGGRAGFQSTDPRNPHSSASAQTRFRPPRFAAYSASSARLMRSPAASPAR